MALEMINFARIKTSNKEWLQGLIDSVEEDRNRGYGSEGDSTREYLGLSGKIVGPMNNIRTTGLWKSEGEYSFLYETDMWWDSRCDSGYLILDRLNRVKEVPVLEIDTNSRLAQGCWYDMGNESGGIYAVELNEENVLEVVSEEDLLDNLVYNGHWVTDASGMSENWSEYKEQSSNEEDWDDDNDESALLESEAMLGVYR